MNGIPNVRLPAGWSELRHHLALGIEAVDALLGTIVATPVTVTLLAPDQPRPGRPPTRLARLGSGRHALLYDGVDGGQVGVRVSDPSRRYAPRRLAIDVLDVETVVAAQRSGAAPPELARRMVRIWLWPGAAYPVGGRTVLRGRVSRAGRGVPWVRVAASLDPGGEPAGLAHGDSQGEFLLVLSLPDGFVGAPPDPLPVTLDIFEPAVPEPAPPAVTGSAEAGRSALTAVGEDGLLLAVGAPTGPPPFDVVPFLASDPPRPAEVDGDAARGVPLTPTYRRSVPVGAGPPRAEIPLGRVSARHEFRLAAP